MFKLLSIITTATALSLGAGVFADEEDLFSEFSSSSVFSGTSDSGSSSDSKHGVPRRIIGSARLRDLIKTAGFDARTAGDRAVTAEKKLEPWTFPVLLVISEDETTINVVLGLTTIKDAAKELPAEKLLKMMSASQENAPALFAYQASRQRTELSMVLKNSNLTGQTIRDEINRMAILARKTAGMWASDSQKSTASAESQKPVVPKSPTTTTDLTGKWSASRSAKEAFAVEFKGDGSFNLVYIKDGKQTKSSGRFTAKDGTLTLSGSGGMKLQGRLTITSEKEFRFTPQNSAALVFAKAQS